MSIKKPGRNEPCPCGSGRKYKQCCLPQDEVQATRKARLINMPITAPSPVSHADDAETHHNIGNSFQTQGMLDAAVESYRKALSLKPDYAEVHNNLGIALRAQGKLDASIESYRKALSLKPGYAKAHNNLGNALQAQSRFDMAIEHYRQACLLKPDYADAYNNMGNALLTRNDPDAAVESYRKALSLKPDYAEALYNLGNAFQVQNKLDEAVESYRKALKLQPYYVSAHNNMGTVLLKQGKLSAAVESYRNVLMLQPDFAEAYGNLGNALRDQGKLDEAIASYRKALLLKPDYIEAHSNLLLALSYQCLPVQYLAEANSYGSKVLAQAKPYTHWTVHNDSLPLKIGFISGDLREHPVGFFLESILAHLNPARVELVAYSTVPQEDSLTARIKPHFVAWNIIADLDDAAAARKIYADGIHILIDLAGHTAHNRLPVFAWHPAPVQVSWLGYFASTGVPGMDYLLTDPVSTPEYQREHFIEKVWYLPDTRLCFTPPSASPKLSIRPLPALHNGYITFGCFQRLFKINDGVLALWGQILRALPQARLRLQNVQLSCSDTSEQLLLRLARIGIAPERVTLVGGLPREENLAAHADVDIILDTFPCPGGTTTCEDLWMGVPTLTLGGNTLLSRQGASLLACAGLEDWIACDEKDYVTRVLAHAANISHLAELRFNLRDKVFASPLCDAPRFALHLEDALYGMWHQKMNF